MTARTPESLIRRQAWVYENAGRFWQDGLIVGNGNLGALAYAPHHLEWMINKVDVFDGRVRQVKLTPHREVMREFKEGGHSTAMFLREWEKGGTAVDARTLSAAVLKLKFGESVGWAAPVPHKVGQTLDFWEGELETRLDSHLSHPVVKCVVPRGGNALCVQLTGCGAYDRSHWVELCRPFNEELEPPVWKAFEGGMVFSQKLPHEGAWYAVAVACSGTSSTTFQQLKGRMRQEGDCELVVAVRTAGASGDAEGQAVAEAREAVCAGYARLREANAAWWRAYWGKAWADFGEHRDIQRYWTFSLYELACAFGQAPMPGLNGLWHGAVEGESHGVGCPGYVHDQNAQIPAMPIAPLNRLELFPCFADTYLERLDELKAHTRELFGRDGVCLPLMMNQLGQEVPVGEYRYTLCGSAYTGLVLSLAWRHSRDVELLRDKIYPLLRELVDFHVGGMELGEDGLYHWDWEIPPEIFTMTRDGTATLGMLRTCLETAVEASGILQRDAGRRAKWLEILAKYPKLARHPGGGWWGGPDIPPDHYCHGAHLLYPFFPGESYVDAASRDVARRTVDYVENFSVDRSFADKDGKWHHRHDWSWFLTTVASMRLGRREEAWAALQDFLRLFAKPNGLFSHNAVVELEPDVTEANLASLPQAEVRKFDGALEPLAVWGRDGRSAGGMNPLAKRLVSPVLEGSSAFLFAATEALLQSFGGEIKLFPGVPAGFSGGFHKLLAQGAFEVSAEMVAGAVSWIEVKSLAGGVAALSMPWRGAAPDIAGPNVRLSAPSGDVLEMSAALGRGEVWAPLSRNRAN